VWRGSFRARMLRAACRLCAGAPVALLATAMLLAAGAPAGHAGEAGRGFAVLIGVDDFSRAAGFDDLPACVNDALGIAAALATQALYTAPPGETRVHVFLAPRSGEPGVRPAEVLNAKVHVGFDDGSAPVLAALSEVAEKATRADDLVLVYLATHGLLAEAEPGQQLRFLLPGYQPDTPSTFLTFDQLAGSLQGVKAQVVFLLNACDAGGGTGSASEAYLERPLSQRHGYRCVIPSCARDEQSWIGPGKAQSLFGECVIEALHGKGLGGGQTEVTVHNLIEYLVDHVGKRALALGKQQTLTFQSVRQYSAGEYARVVLATVEPGPPAPALPSGPPVVTPIPAQGSAVGPTPARSLPPCITDAARPAGRARTAGLETPPPHARSAATAGRVVSQPADIWAAFPTELPAAAPPTVQEGWCTIPADRGRSLAPPAAPSRGVPPVYTVQRGDNLTLISRRLGVSTAELVRCNRLANPDQLTVGAALLLPEGGPQTTTPATTRPPLLPADADGFAKLPAQTPDHRYALPRLTVPLTLPALVPTPGTTGASEAAPPAPTAERALTTRATGMPHEPLALPPLAGPAGHAFQSNGRFATLPFTVPAGSGAQVLVDGTEAELWAGRLPLNDSLGKGEEVVVRQGDLEFWHGRLIKDVVRPADSPDGFLRRTLRVAPAVEGLVCTLRPVRGRVPHCDRGGGEPRLFAATREGNCLVCRDLPVGTYDLAVHLPGLTPIKARIPLSDGTGDAVVHLRSLLTARQVLRAIRTFEVSVKAMRRGDGQPELLAGGTVLSLAPTAEPLAVQALKRLQEAGVGDWRGVLAENPAPRPAPQSVGDDGAAPFSGVWEGEYRVEVATANGAPGVKLSSAPLMVLGEGEANRVDATLLVE